MKNAFLFLGAAALIAVASFMLWSCGGKGKKETVREIPLEDFFKNPEKSSVRISPDGKYITYKASWENRMNIFIQEVGKTEAKRLTSEKDRDIAGYFWSSPNQILYLKDVGGDENYRLFGVSPDGSNLRAYTDFEGVRTDVYDDLEDNDEEVIIGMNKRKPEVFDAYRLNTTTGELTMIAENPGNIIGWMCDHDGKLRVAFESDGVNQSLLYRATEKDPFKKVITTNFRETLSPMFFTFDNQRLYCLSNIGRDKTAAIEFDPATGKEVKVVYENPDYEVSRLVYSRKRKVLTYAVYDSWKTEYHYFDKETEDLHKAMKAKAEGYELSVVSKNRDENLFIAVSWNDRQNGVYYIYDQGKDEMKEFAKISPWLKEDELAEMKPVEFKSRDGLTIHGYLTLPKSAEPKNLPVVINVHGGPWARDEWGFNPEVQFLANRGFAVFQINYRGSTGYGRKFWEASFKQWGKNMQNDITDGVNWLISEGIADKEKVAIYGGSYGGYATLAGLAFTPDLYACGIDYVGVSNLFTFMKTIPPYWTPFLDMMYEMVGHPEKDSLLLAEASPVFHADKIKVPLFIAQGANDPRVNKAESDQMVEAMRKRGVEVEYLVKDNEGHGFHNQENRFEFYNKMIVFLNKHIGKESTPKQ